MPELYVIMCLCNACFMMIVMVDHVGIAGLSIKEDLFYACQTLVTHSKLNVTAAGGCVFVYFGLYGAAVVIGNLKMAHIQANSLLEVYQC